mgnify:CR=1 FL=1
MKKICVFLLLLILPFSVLASDTIPVMESQKNSSLAINATSAILIEATTGKILFEKNSHEKLAPASMTKIMSMLVIVESIEKGVINWDDVVTVSENASSMGGSQILLETGEKMKVSDLFKGIAVASGNDAVVALAETIAGTVDEFVNMMNNKAKELGLKDTNFKNPHGLDEANHYSSAYDMSIMAKELIKHEKVLEFTSIYEDYLRKGTDREFWLVNTNKLVRFYNGADGLKTGYTGTAGYCLTATAKKNNVRLIAVAMNEPTSSTRNAEISSMLDYGFAKIKTVEVANTKTIIKKIEIDKSKNKYVEIVPTDNITIVKQKTEQVGEITYDFKLNKIKAPIKKGEVIGKLIINEDGKKISEAELTVKENVEKANFLELYFRNITDMINGKIIFK